MRGRQQAAGLLTPRLQNQQFHAKCNVQPITTRRHSNNTNPRTLASRRVHRPAMSTITTRERRGGGVSVVRQFPVGRRRYVPVVDAGCGCRPRRPRLLGLPSFLKSGCQLGGKAVAVVVRRGAGEQYSSSSTSSFSSSCAATHSTGYSSAYSSDYYYYSTATKQELPKAAAASPAARKKEPTSKKKTAPAKKKKAEAEAEVEEEGVGVAVEKESRDPRADFRESMVQMVVEMGLCDWDGLRCMLRRLLALNAPRHHAAILTAFAEVCAQIIAAPTAAASSPQPSPSPPPAYHHYRR